MKRMLCALLLMAGCHGPVREYGFQQDAVFKHDVKTKAKPWTHLRFRHNPDDFQFAFVTDRTGGHRPGVFPKAIERLNWLQPEFVVSVGDLIEGMTENSFILDQQWKEFESFTAKLEMPFFYLPGNHDISNPKMRRLWKKKFGTAWFSFTYRDVLFLCLDTQDGPETRSTSPLLQDSTLFIACKQAALGPSWGQDRTSFCGFLWRKPGRTSKACVEICRLNGMCGLASGRRQVPLRGDPAAGLRACSRSGQNQGIAA